MWDRGQHSFLSNRQGGDTMPDRIIRDRARSSPTLRQLSDGAERAWWRLTTAADDYGRFDADPDVLLAELFKRRPSSWTTAKMRRVVEEWADTDDPLIHLYQVDGDCRVYGHAVTWTDHQRGRDSKPKFPDPPCGGSPQSAAKCRESLQLAARARALGSESRESLSTESRETVTPSLAANCREAADGVLKWLNTKAQRNFPANKTNLGFILARMKEGVTPEQLKAIVSRKVRQWGSSEKMSGYLRPATLFNQEKCSQYLGELPAPKEPDDKPAVS